MNETGFKTPGEIKHPSPSIWADADTSDLNYLSKGLFICKQFKGEDATLPGMQSDSDTSATYLYSADAAKTHSMVMSTAATDNDAVSILTRPVQQLIPFSNQKLWIEASISLTSITEDKGVFIGFAAGAALSKDVLADGAAATIATASSIGLIIRSDNLTKVDAVKRKNTGSEVIIQADVTNSNSFPEGVTGSDLVVDQFVKLGIRFNGWDQMDFYVNGHVVASDVIDDTYDTTNLYGGVVSVKAGAAIVADATLDFFRFAVQDRV